MKKHLETKTGMTYEEIIKSEWSLIDKNIEEKTGKKLINRNIGNYFLCRRGRTFVFLEQTIDLNQAKKKYKVKRKNR